MSFGSIMILVLNGNHNHRADAFAPRAMNSGLISSSFRPYTSHPFRDDGCDNLLQFRPPTSNDSRARTRSPWATHTRTRARSVRSLTSLHMAATKSGGRPILSERQFRIEILHEDDCDEEEYECEYVEMDDNYDDDDDVDDDSEDGNYGTPPSSSSQGAGGSNDNLPSFEPVDIPTLVLYSAPWCGPCRLSNPVVKEIVKEFVPDQVIDVVEICTDDLPEVAEAAGVVSIPTMQIYYRGELLDTIVGCVAKNVLMSAINKILEDLDLMLDGVEEEGEEVGEGISSSSKAVKVEDGQE